MSPVQSIKTQIVLGGTQIHHASKDPFKDLVDKTASTALYNNATIAELGKCHPGTRTAILERLEAAAQHDDGMTDERRSIIWMYGSAGSGKSAIMRTLCENLDTKQQLLASFFFRASTTHCVSDQFVLTLVVQFCRAIPGMRDLVAACISNDPFIFSHSLETQLRSLLVQPVLDLHAADRLSVSSRAVVVDGLDECRSEARRKQILRLLYQLTAMLPFPILIYIASRPHYDIRRELESPDVQPKVLQEALNQEPEVDSDIRTFLEDEFKQIATTHPLHQYLPLVDGFWPSLPIITLLVQKASGQFIFVTTVIRFIRHDRSNPEERLQIILGSLPAGKLQPYQELDTLYLTILNCNVDQEDIQDVSNIFGIALTSYNTHSFPFALNPYLDRRIDPHFIDTVLGCSRGWCRRLLLGLESVLTVGRDDEPIQFFHQSFYDFLSDKHRSGNFHFTPTSTYDLLLRSFVSQGFWFQDGRIHEFEINNFRRMLKSLSSLESTPYIQDISFDKFDKFVTRKAELTTGPVWIDLCSSFLEGVDDDATCDSQNHQDASKSDLYRRLYSSFLAVVHRRIRDVYFAYPETLIALYTFIRPADLFPHSNHDGVDYMDRISPTVLGLEGEKGFCLFTPYRRLGRNQRGEKLDPLRDAVRDALEGRGGSGKPKENIKAMESMVNVLSMQDASVIKRLSVDSLLVTVFLGREEPSASLARAAKAFALKYARLLSVEDRATIHGYIERASAAKSATPRVKTISLKSKPLKSRLSRIFSPK